MNCLALALAAGLLLNARSASAQNGIFVVSLGFPGEIAQWFETEYARVEKLCSYPDPECWSRNLQHKTWTLNDVRSSPDPEAPQIGAVVVLSAYEPGAPHLRFDYRPLRGPQSTWLSAEEIGDWGYGIEIVVLARGEPSQGDRSTWVRLRGVSEPAWIELPPSSRFAAGELVGTLEPLDGRIFTVEDGVLAINRRTGRRAPLPSRYNYVVERISGGQLFVRQEVGADMPCGDENDEKDRVTAATPRYRVNAEHVFKKDGKPRLRIAYPRGC